MTEVWSLLLLAIFILLTVLGADCAVRRLRLLFDFTAYYGDVMADFFTTPGGPQEQ